MVDLRKFRLVKESEPILSNAVSSDNLTPLSLVLLVGSSGYYKTEDIQFQHRVKSLFFFANLVIFLKYPILMRKIPLNLVKLG